MRWLKRILVAVGIVLLGIILLLVGSVALDSLFGHNRLDPLTNTRITVPNGMSVRAHVARPSGPGPYPVMIMIHEFWGLTPELIGKAQALAEEGYVVVAPDTFRGSTTRWLPRAIYQTISTPTERVNQDLDTVYAWLEAQPEARPERIGIMGFCYGGGKALRYSLHNSRLAAIAVFYGTPITDPETLRVLKAPVLGVFGTADSSIPVVQVRAFQAALNEAGIPNQITLYEGQPHAFVKDMASIRGGGAQGQAWKELLDFLQRTLRK